MSTFEYVLLNLAFIYYRIYLALLRHVPAPTGSVLQGIKSQCAYRHVSNGHSNGHVSNGQVSNGHVMANGQANGSDPNTILVIY